jgi:hypothetical protein
MAAAARPRHNDSADRRHHAATICSVLRQGRHLTELREALCHHRTEGHDINEGNAEEQPLFVAIVTGHHEAIPHLIEFGANVHTQEPLFGETPLHQAVIHRRIDIMTTLRDLGASPNTRDQDGRTPLHTASWEGSWEAVSLLIQSGAKLDVLDKCGWSPWHTAMHRTYDRIASDLLLAGADPTQSPIHDSFLDEAAGRRTRFHRQVDTLLRSHPQENFTPILVSTLLSSHAESAAWAAERLADLPKAPAP